MKKNKKEMAIANASPTLKYVGFHLAKAKDKMDLWVHEDMVKIKFSQTEENKFGKLYNLKNKIIISFRKKNVQVYQIDKTVYNDYKKKIHNVSNQNVMKVVEENCKKVLEGKYRWDSERIEGKFPVEKVMKIVNHWIKVVGKRNGHFIPKNHALTCMIYPALEPVVGGEWTEIPAEISKFFRLPAKEMAKKITGAKNPVPIYKSIRKEGQYSLDFGAVTLCSIWKGLVPLEDLYRILEEEVSKYSCTSMNKTEFRKLVRQMKQFLVSIPKEKRRRILREMLAMRNVGFEFLTDVVRMWSELKAQGIEMELEGSMNSIHDRMAREHRRMKTTDRRIEVPKELIDVEVGNMKIIPAGTTHQLADWGRAMDNCISSYGEQAVEGQNLLIGIERNQELIYTLEIRNKEIVQFKAKHNANADAKDIVEVTAKLKELKIIK